MRIIITPEAARGALKIIGIYLAGVFLVSFLVFLICDSASAESAIVSFNDAEHLAALADSVEVCDTTWRYTRMQFDSIMYNQPNKANRTVWDINTPGSEFYIYNPMIIICHKQAIIFYKSYRPVGEVKQ